MTTDREEDFTSFEEDFARETARIEAGRRDTDASSFVGPFFQPKPGGGTPGKPQTNQEREFILNFINFHGRAPTSREVTSQFRTQVDPFSLDFSPGSTPFEMGFRTFEDFENAQREGSTAFGPFAGNLVPEGGDVLTRDGVPFVRSFDPSEFGPLRRRGEFFTPTAPEAPTFPIPEAGDPLERFEPNQVFNARLDDFLDNSLQRDATALSSLEAEYNTAFAELESKRGQTFPQRGAGGEVLGGGVSFDFETALSRLNADTEAKLENLMTPAKAEEIRQANADLIRQEIPIEQRPLFEDVKDFAGQRTTALIQKGTSAQEELRAGAEERRAAALQPEPQRRRDFSQPTGNEEAEFRIYVSRLDVAPQWRDWLNSQAQNLFLEWQSERTNLPFIEWLSERLARG